ncbi:MAG: LytTR family DNA-binding domain-containing protein [Firmicutes bacterium]|nr:LytTR family DNA-binding domain-containing protein [Bacillota bacterium]
MSKNLMVKVRRKIYSIPFEHIIFLESNVRKTNVHTKNGVITYYGKIKDAEEKLDERFMCCHKSYIINMDEISCIEDGKIVLNEGESEYSIFLGRDTSRKAIKCYEEYIKKRT